LQHDKFIETTLAEDIDFKRRVGEFVFVDIDKVVMIL